MITTNESKEDYLERILMLQENGNSNVHAVDIAESMGYSKASVSIALKKLEDSGLVSVGEKQVLTLTEEGRKIAKKIYERHQVIGGIFIAIGVSRKPPMRMPAKSNTISAKKPSKQGKNITLQN